MADILGTAKEIVIAAIQSNKIIQPGSSSDTAEVMNEKYAKEVSKFYKTVAKSIYETYNKDFEVK